MLNRKEKFTLFLTSYIPLWFIFIIKLFFLEKNIENHQSIIFKTFSYKKLNLVIDVKAIILLLLFLLIIWKLYSLNKILEEKRGQTSPINIKNVKNISIDYLTNYFSLYLFPFVALSGTDTLNIFIFFIIICLAGYIYVKNDIVYINPILHFLGYSIFIVEITKSNNQTEEVFLMTARKRYEIGTYLNKLYKFEKDFYFEKKSKT